MRSAILHSRDLMGDSERHLRQSIARTAQWLLPCASACKLPGSDDVCQAAKTVAFILLSAVVPTRDQVFRVPRAVCACGRLSPPRFRVAFAILLALLLAACATVPQSPQKTVAVPPLAGLDPQPFVPPVPVPSSAALFELTAAQQAAFIREFNDPAQAGVAPHARLAGYIEGRLALFRYDGATRTASDALASDEGNCLSLALVTTALARLAGVEVGYQRMREEPVFDRQDKVVLVADHVRSLLFDPSDQPEAGELTGFEPHIVIDYFPDRRRRRGGRVDEQTLQSMFYANLAAEALAADRNREAYWTLDAALRHDPASADALNALAVLQRRIGNPAVAEQVYRHALGLHPADLSLLGNYRSLLTAQGRHAEAAGIDRRLEALPVRNPYDLIDRGNQAFTQDRPQAALQWYRQALEQAPYLHEAYWRQAVVHHALGEHAQAAALLERAANATARPRDRHQYEAKAQLLRELKRQ